MKEATGDLNMTVIVVTIVALFVAFFSMTLWPMIKGGIKSEANCNDAICKSADCNNGECTCIYYTDKTKNESVEIVCPYKG